MNAPTPRKVVIEVSGGIAEVTQCPEDVEVEIIDHDNVMKWADAFEKQGVPKDTAMELAKKLHEEIEKKIVVKP